MQTQIIGIVCASINPIQIRHINEKFFQFYLTTRNVQFIISSISHPIPGFKPQLVESLVRRPCLKTAKTPKRADRFPPIYVGFPNHTQSMAASNCLD